MAGQVAGAINDVIRVAEFVPAMAAEAAEVLVRLAANLPAVVRWLLRRQRDHGRMVARGDRRAAICP